MKLLVVEPYDNLRKVIISNIKDVFPELVVMEAACVQSAWERVIEEVPEVVASCIHMRVGKSGVELLRMVKEHYPYVKVVIFSDYIGHEIQPEEMIRMGAYAAFPKSFELVYQINGAISQLQFV